MPKGFRVAHAYVDIDADMSGVRGAVRDIPRELGPDADRAGRDLSKRITDGLEKQVEQLSARLTKARRAEVDAANAVALAEKKLSEARESGRAKGSQLLALEQQLEKAKYRVAEANSAASAATNKHADAQQKLAAALDDIANGAGPEAEHGGRDLGDKLSMGMEMAIMRNSPLIVAAIGAALAAGAPVAIAGASALFAGIGIVAAAQSEQVQSAWSSTWTAISRGAQQDAAVLVPVLTKAAETIGASFQRMRPLLQDAFAASAPLIDTFVTSVTRAAENALPGMVRAVQAAGPVFDGLGSLMESIGTGLSDFFDKLSEHAPAAGQAFAALGDILGELLPILGELLGQGVELAAVVLPPLASILGVVASALDQVGGVLPAVVAGFTGMKVISGLNTMLGNVSTRMAAVAAQGGLFSGAAGSAAGATGRLSGAFSTLSSAAPIIGTALALVATNFMHAEQAADSAARAMVQGGSGARSAAADIHSSIIGIDAAWVDSVDTWIKSVPVIGAAWDLITTSTKEGSDSAQNSLRDLVESMSPLQRAQAEVTYWTNELAAAQGDASYVIQDLEGNTITAAEAQYMLGAAGGEAARIQAELDQTVSGMSRTLEQAAEAADQLSSALDALNGGQLDLNEAQRDFQQAIDDANAALVDNGRNLDINTEAGRANAAALDDIAAAGNAQAEALYKQTGNYDQFSNKLIEGRNALYDAARAFGMSDEAARAYVDSVLAIPPITSMEIETNTDTVRGELQLLQGQLSGLQPGQAVVTWASPEVIQILSDLGYDIEGLPTGEVRITAKDESQPITDAVLAQLAAITGPTIAQITADPTQFTDMTVSVLQQLGLIDGTTPNPTISADPAPAIAATDEVLDGLLGVGGQNPTPTISANPDPFNSVYGATMGQVGTLDSQNPTPTASLNAGPLNSSAGGALSLLGIVGLQRPSPTATLLDYVSGPAGAARAAIYSIPLSRTTTITTVQRTVMETLRYNGPYGGAALGGSVDAFMAAAQRRDGGGPVTGPGGPRDDLIPALLGGRVPFRLSNGEHVLDAEDVSLMGGQAAVYRFRELLGTGVLDPRTWTRRDGGGPVEERAASRADVMASRSVSVEHLHLHVEGTGIDLSRMSDQDMRRFLSRVRDGLVDMERGFA